MQVSSFPGIHLDFSMKILHLVSPSRKRKEFRRFFFFFYQKRWDAIIFTFSVTKLANGLFKKMQGSKKAIAKWKKRDEELTCIRKLLKTIQIIAHKCEKRQFLYKFIGLHDDQTKTRFSSHFESVRLRIRNEAEAGGRDLAANDLY